MSSNLRKIWHIPSRTGQGAFDVDSLSEEKITELNDDLTLNRFECRSCGYVYDPLDGIKKFAIPKGTPFLDLDKATFRCPVCREGVEAYRDIGPRSQPSGFQENMNYGFGANSLTPGQKNVLIFGALAFAVACFLSLYSLH